MFITAESTSSLTFISNDRFGGDLARVYRKPIILERRVRWGVDSPWEVKLEVGGKEGEWKGALLSNILLTVYLGKPHKKFFI